MKSAFLAFYFFLLFFIAFYGVHLYWLIILYLRHGREKVSLPGGPIARQQFPFVTVQLPVYNEKRVALRLLKAALAFDWPKDRLEIQVLDDSTDITSDLIAGFLDANPDTTNVRHIRRERRDGYKAGALAHGLRQARGDYIAVFDADNVPHPDFLTNLMPHFNDSQIGMVQARWSFLNRTESFLCRAQALFLDAHFHVEQQARYRGGLLFNFNGTAGIWRREAIESAGSWQHDTLTEDLDLSVRAQLAGWRFVYRNDYTVPTELPNTITAFKTQQYRWAKGAVQTGLKMLPAIFRSGIALKAKTAAWFHFTHKAVALALLLLSIMLIPALYIRLEGGITKLLLIDLPIFIAGTGSMTLFYGLANREKTGERTWRDHLTMPVLTSLGVALAATNTRALLSALFRRNTAFIRTPKSGSIDGRRKRIPRAYHYAPDRIVMLELLLAVYAAGAACLATGLGLYFTLPFLLTFAVGYGYFSYNGLRDRYAR